MFSVPVGNGASIASVALHTVVIVAALIAAVSRATRSAATREARLTLRSAPITRVSSTPPR